MKILAIEHELPDGTADEFQKVAKEEARRVWELTQSGVIREAYFRADRNEAVLVLECDSIQQAREVLETLPFVREKLIIFEVIPLKAYPGFARLFNK
jgi:muconolactone delta-isomerase